MATIKINRYTNKKGNSYKTIDEAECVNIICKKLKVSTTPKLDNEYQKNIQKFINIEQQVKNQYNCNSREIIFTIN